MYHRGHTWVKPEPDGTVLVGLDELAARVTGQAIEVDLPAAGSRVRVNGMAWEVRRDGTSARVLSPVDGTVVEKGGPESGWFLRIKPDKTDQPHLLSGGEARAWMQRELERVGMLLAVPAVGPSLADGGVMVEDLPAASPDADWDAVWGGVFLQP
jgi:glycine cleavage system H protein